jgi:hypothetical protein
MRHFKRQIAILRFGQMFISLCLFGFPALSAFAEVNNLNKAFFRPETGMHTKVIKRIDVDAKERYLVTGSLDKTVRVWSLLDNGKLIQILRPPIDKGNEGKIHAVAISPDGETVAAGGWTGHTWEGTYSIYLFNRKTGEMNQRLPGHPHLIFHLAYSPDGRYLVANLGQQGIRVYRTSDYHLQAQDTDYGDASYWANFDQQGRLVTSCWDGYLRLYDQKFKLLAKRKVFGGNQPFAVDFSPTGNTVVVGFADSNTINVLSGMDLTLLSEPQTLDVNGNLNTVAWSKDGQWLYAGGTHLENNQTFILRWNRTDQSRYDKWPAASNTILDIRALRDGGLVFGTFDPTFGRFNANGDKILERDAGIADFRIADFRYDKGLQVSMDGSQIEFNYNQGEQKRTRRFSVRDRSLAAVKSLDKRQPSMTIPIINSSYFDITGEINTTDFKINGQLLQLLPDEMVRSFAITKNEQHILVGTDWSLRLLDRKGQLKWQQTAPAIPWDVKIAGNGKVAVAAFSDGILRWYRISDGAELLAYFPYEGRWIIWTPRSHYMASPGGENIMGWYVNRGQTEAAQFFPLGKFRSQFYSPQIVKNTLMLYDIDEAILLADEINSLKQTFKQSLIRHYSPEVVNKLVDNLKLAEATRFSILPEIKKLHAKKPVKKGQSQKTSSQSSRRLLGQKSSSPSPREKTSAQSPKPTLQESLPPEIKMLALVEPDPNAKTESRGISNVASRGISGVVSRGISGVVSRGSKKASFATSVVELRYRLRIPSGEPITALQVLVDGQKIGGIKNKNPDDASKPIEICDLSQQTRGISNVASRGISNVASRGISNVASRDVSTSTCQLPQDEKEYHLRISLPPRDVKVGLVVENRFVTSQPIAIELQWKGKVTETPQPNLYVLAVGVSKYDNKELTLNFAAKDANDFANALRNQKGKLYKDVTIKQLPDASKKEVLDGLAWLRSQVQLGDVAMLFLAGHGVNIGGHGSDSKQQYFFLPRDAKVKTETEIKGSSVFFRDIKKTVMNLPGKVLFFLDTCHSGNVMGDGLIDVDDVTNDVGSAEREAIVVFTATTGEQLALESPDWGNGAFTKTLLEGLRGEADYKGDKEISFKEIDLYLSDGVEELTEGQQTPTVAIPRAVRNFPLASTP